MLAESAPSIIYVGGTVTTPAGSTEGTLDLSSPDVLRFRSSTNSVDIPWDSIQSWDCSAQLAHHLGVLPTIAVGLVRKRQRVHYFRVVWWDRNHNVQGMLFEIPKQFPNILETALDAHVPGKSRMPTHR
jgi:hypothetical protein